MNRTCSCLICCVNLPGGWIEFITFWMRHTVLWDFTIKNPLFRFEIMLHWLRYHSICSVFGLVNYLPLVNHTCFFYLLIWYLGLLLLRCPDETTSFQTCTSCCKCHWHSGSVVVIRCGMLAECVRRCNAFFIKNLHLCNNCEKLRVKLLSRSLNDGLEFHSFLCF